MLDSAQLGEMLIRTVAKGGNLELNVGPTGEGNIPATMQIPLRNIGKFLRSNAEAVYGTVGFPFGRDVDECETGDANVDRCYTYNADTDTIYAITMGYPQNVEHLTFDKIKFTDELTVTLVGAQDDAEPLEWIADDAGGVKVTVPSLVTIENIGCFETKLFTLKFSSAKTQAVSSQASKSCNYSSEAATVVNDDFTCETQGATSSVSVTLDSSETDKDTVHSVTTRTTVYRADEPAEAERVVVASITMGMGTNGTAPGQVRLGFCRLERVNERTSDANTRAKRGGV